MRTLKITGKVSDMCGVTFRNTKTEAYADNDGYVPRGIGIGGGDYLELTIDVDTGKIVGWKPISDKTLIEAIQDM